MSLFSSAMSKLFGTHSEREVKSITPLVDKIEAMADTYRQMSEAELKSQTGILKQRLAQGETLDDILPEAFAAVREAADRVLGMRPYRVQLIGGIILHQGRIAEMKTGEGKTLVEVLPAYLNALTGNGVHIVTVNDYLAKRDSEWMGKVFRYMGLKVGLIVHGLTNDQRREAYAADITYGTNNEMGFDYLRDNMAVYKKDMVQRGHNFAIVDEVDSILIDEARTPLIISGKGEASSALYAQADSLVAGMKKMVFADTDDKEAQDDLNCDYVVNEKDRVATLTARGIAKAEAFFGIENLSDPENTTISHHVNQALKARGIMKRDIDYVVKDGQVIIVDEFTGRLMHGRRYSEGLHQAIEAKEGVDVANESKTLATITFQNYFRLYTKLSGMTGTALTEEDEFIQIYKLDVIEIPTNKPVVRIDHPDTVYKTEAGKFRAVIRQIKECHDKGQPVLVGTISIEKSEELSRLLKREGIPHSVLNAKHHEAEAEIVAQAGKLGAVTIATNMAGRGTDIMLGGNPEYMALSDLRKQGLEEELIAEANSYADTEDEAILSARAAYTELYEKYHSLTSAEGEKVRAAGGLFVIGTERHESRRIDNQLRGRSGRQGDPGESRFYISLEDDLMRLFGSERVSTMMDRLGLDEDTPIDQKILSGAIENAQKKKEGLNFQTRKSVLEYDDVMNTQRKVIYGQRQQVLDGEDVQASLRNMRKTIFQDEIHAVMGEKGYLENREELQEILKTMEGLYFPKGAYAPDDQALSAVTAESLLDELMELSDKTYAAKEAVYGSPLMREAERVILLRVVDEYWMDQIDAMQDLRQGIVLRAYGQSDPVVEYKREGYAMFEDMIRAIQEETTRRLYLFRVQQNEPLKREKVAKVTSTGAGGDGTVRREPIKKKVKVGRNDPCPCGSGKKYKNCCLDKDMAAGKNVQS